MTKMGEGMEKPPYFTRMEALNLNGPIIFGTLPQPPPLSPRKVIEAQEGGALVLDVREPHNFAAAHVPRSLNVWLNGLPVYGGYAIPYGRPLIIVAERQQEVDTAVRYLIRIGYEDMIGHLENGMESWIKGGNATSTIPASTVHEIRRRQLAGEEMLLVDLRDRRELDSRDHPRGDAAAYWESVGEVLGATGRQGDSSLLRLWLPRWDSGKHAAQQRMRRKLPSDVRRGNRSERCPSGARSSGRAVGLRLQLRG